MQEYMAEVLVNDSEIADQLIHLFNEKHLWKLKRQEMEDKIQRLTLALATQKK